MLARRRMASCSSSLDGDETRTCRPESPPALLELLSLRNLTMSFAASVGMPCCSYDPAYRAVGGALDIAGVRFLVGTPRRTIRPCRISQNAVILESSSAVSVSGFRRG